jgi:hypothetical protein
MAARMVGDVGHHGHDGDTRETAADCSLPPHILTMQKCEQETTGELE